MLTSHMKIALETSKHPSTWFLVPSPQPPRSQPLYNQHIPSLQATAIGNKGLAPFQSPAIPKIPPVTPLKSTLTEIPVSVASKRLMGMLNPLKSTHTKKRGVGEHTANQPSRLPVRLYQYIEVGPAAPGHLDSQACPCA